MTQEYISSRDNPLIRHYAKLLRERSYREECREYVLEGAKLLSEAVSSGVIPASICFAEGAGEAFDFAELKKETAGVRVCRVDSKLFNKISDLKTPQGIVFSCPLPDTKLPGALPRGNYIILDGLSDPGNMGTIIRTADAFGIDGVILTNGCTDLFSPKTVRSAMGSLFRVKLFEAAMDDLSKILGASSVPVVSAVLSEGAKSVSDIELKNCAVVIGNEAHGISDYLKNLSSELIKIPMRGQTESLNAAVSAAVIMWEMTKRR